MQSRIDARGPFVPLVLLISALLTPARGQEPLPRIRAVSLPDGGQAVAARIDAAGVIHVLYNTPDGPKYRSSADHGKKFGPPIPVVDRDSLRPGLEYLAWDLAVSPRGEVHAALGTNAWKLKLPKEEWGLYYARLEPGTRAFSPLKNINRRPSEGFSLAADEGGRVTACWLSDKLYANLSRDGGRTWGETIELSAEFDPCNCCTTSATYGADGKLALLYREETNNERDMYLVLWDQERGSVARKRVSVTPWQIDACPMTYYAISPTPTGYTAVWPTQSEIYFARLDAAGDLLAPHEIKTPGTSGMRTGMLALTAPQGASLVVWKNEEEISWQMYRADGRPVNKPNSAKSPGKGAAAVFAKDGTFVLIK